jgi:hypothetical protein
VQNALTHSIGDPRLVGGIIVFFETKEPLKHTELVTNYSVNAATVALAPSKGWLCGATNCSAKIRHPRSGDDRKDIDNEMAVFTQ